MPQIINSISVTDVPSTVQRKTEYNADGTIKYIGYAPMGASVDDTTMWTVYAFDYVNSQEVAKTTALTSWTLRGAATYA